MKTAEMAESHGGEKTLESSEEGPEERQVFSTIRVEVLSFQSPRQRVWGIGVYKRERRPGPHTASSRYKKKMEKKDEQPIAGFRKASIVRNLGR